MSSIDDLRLLFDAEIRRIDQVLSEREKQTNFALDAAQHAIDKSEQEAVLSRAAAKELVSQETHDILQAEVDYLRRGYDAASGRRTAWVAAAGIIATIIAIGVGQIIRQGITSADVSEQIRTEAPWNKDKASVERRISILERQVQLEQVEIAKLQSDLRAHIVLDTRH